MDRYKKKKKKLNRTIKCSNIAKTITTLFKVECSED